MQKKSGKREGSTDGDAGEGGKQARPAKKRVKRAVADSASQEAKTKPAAERVRKAAVKRVRNYRKHAKKELSEAFPVIVQTLVKKAEEGSLTHAKLLFDIGGVKDAAKAEGRKRKSSDREPSLAEMLLDEVKKRREEAAGAESPEQP